MIYNKEGAFPYPVLMEGVKHYKNNQFEIDINVKEDIENYYFEFEIFIYSDYIKKLVNLKKAYFILIIKSKDNKFCELKDYKFIDDKYIGREEVSKKRCSLNTKSELQVIIKSAEKLNYSDNDDLVDFYDDYKSEIDIIPNAAIAISNSVIFQGSQQNSTKLFEKSLDENLKSEIAIELTAETIHIKYKKNEYQFSSSPNSKVLNYPYIYMGLQKALTQFFITISKDDPDKENEEIYIDDLKSDYFEGLNYKLLSLMKNKGIKEISLENIDEIIYKISDNIIEKYSKAIDKMGDSE